MANCRYCGMPLNDGEEICPACGTRNNYEKSIYDRILELDPDEGLESEDEFFGGEEFEESEETEGFDEYDEYDEFDEFEEFEETEEVRKQYKNEEPEKRIHNKNGEITEKLKKQKINTKKLLIILGVMLVGVAVIFGLLNFADSPLDEPYEPNGTNAVVFGDLENNGWRVSVPEGAVEDMDDIAVEGWINSDSGFAEVKISSNFAHVFRADEPIVIALSLGTTVDADDIDFYIAEYYCGNEWKIIFPNHHQNSSEYYIEFETCSFSSFRVRKLGFEEYSDKYARLEVNKYITFSAPTFDIEGYGFWSLADRNIWKDSEIEEAYNAYINGRGFGYSDIQSWDALEEQMRGTRRELCVNVYKNYAALKNISVTDVVSDEKLCRKLEDGIMQNLKIVFDYRNQNQTEAEKLFAEFKNVIQNFDDNDLLTRGIYGFDSKIMLGERLDELFAAREKIIALVNGNTEYFGDSAEKVEYWLGFYTKLWINEADENNAKNIVPTEMYKRGHLPE